MKTNKLLFGLALLAISIFFFASCAITDSAAASLAGTYSGTMQISGDTTIQVSGGYDVFVSVVTDNRVRIETDNFPTFEAEVFKLPSGVNNSSTDPAQIVYTSIINELTIQHTIGNNSMQFTGSRQ